MFVFVSVISFPSDYVKSRVFNKVKINSSLGGGIHPGEPVIFIISNVFCHIHPIYIALMPERDNIIRVIPYRGAYPIILQDS